ncbi:hypothetical protein ACOSQ3_006818 [Xanthoceras sorbifolium]
MRSNDQGNFQQLFQAESIPSNGCSIISDYVQTKEISSNFFKLNQYLQMDARSLVIMFSGVVLRHYKIAACHGSKPLMHLISLIGGVYMVIKPNTMSTVFVTLLFP